VEENETFNTELEFQLFWNHEIRNVQVHTPTALTPRKEKHG
jgi:hypothetical protein